MYLQAIEGGNLINEEVKEHKDAVLLLWVVHNKANIRLAGDISEDPVFPKLKFPTKEFCSSCYDNRVRGGLAEKISNVFTKSLIIGVNLWAEFNRGEVYKFLTNLYTKDKLSSQVKE